MGIVRNLSGVQKGLLAGLFLGIAAVYSCLCLSAVGIIPASLPRLSGAVAIAPTSTSASPIATAESSLAARRASPTAMGETVGEVTETLVVASTYAPVASVATSGLPTRKASPTATAEPEDQATAAQEAVPTNTPAPPTATEMSGLPTRKLSPTATSKTEVEPTATLKTAQTATSPPPTATTGLPTRKPSPTTTSEIEPAATETGTPVAVVPETTSIARATTDTEPKFSLVLVEPEPQSLADEGSLSVSETDTVLPGETEETAGSGARISVTATEMPAEVAGEDMIALSIKKATRAPSATATPAILVLPTRTPKPAFELVTKTPSVLALNAITPSATPGWTWQGVELERIPSSETGNTMAVLAVRVLGLPDREVNVREATSGLSATMVTGRKPEYGDFSDELGGLPASTYVVEPQGIGATTEVMLEAGDFVLIEFALRPPPELSADAEAGETSVPIARGTPIGQRTEPVAPTETAQPIAVAPTRSPMVVTEPAATEAELGVTLTPELGWTWQGVVYEHRKGTGAPFGVIAVRVVDVPDRKVFVKEDSGTWETTLVTGLKPEYGRFSDDVGGLGPGTYTIKPMDIDSQVTVELGGGDFVLVEFALHPPSSPVASEITTVPTESLGVAAQPTEPEQAVQPLQEETAEPTGEPEWIWQGVVYEHNKNTGDPVGIIAVRVVDVPDRKVFVRSESSTWETTLVTGRKPQYGDFSDDVGGLGPGTYTITPMDIDSEVTVTLERGDSVLVEFALRPPPGSAVTGVTGVPTAQATAVTDAVQPAQPTSVPIPSEIVADAAATESARAGWTWQGVEYERTTGTETGNASGVLAVRVVGVPGRNVFVRELSGGWETTLVTGNKPEYGDFSDAVGSLSPGTYVIKPMDIDSEVSVNLGTGDFVLVEFALRPVPGWTPETATVAPPPTATAVTEAAQPTQPAQATAAVVPVEPTGETGWTWQGVEYERQPGTETGSLAAVLAVRVVGVPDRKVSVRELSGGWETTLLTGNKPEYGDFADSVGGLAPGTYVVKPTDIDSEVTVDLAQGDFVLVEFALRPAPGWSPGGDTGAQVADGTPVMGIPVSPDATPTATLVPGWRWAGREIDRKTGAQTGRASTTLVVRGIALPDWQTLVRDASGASVTPLRLQRHAEYGNFAGVVEGLTPGTYWVELADNVGSPAQVTIGQGDFVLLEFFPVPAE
jgi:hypothetical protein